MKLTEIRLESLPSKILHFTEERSNKTVGKLFSKIGWPTQLSVFVRLSKTSSGAGCPGELKERERERAGTCPAEGI